ncbi:hypothetical protein LCGC14_1151620 [marine sediment metagenome]|uniref:Uncharacterized protein n=1 Tax=marine sediment metagenome TaxID=412755 RepID=A0A0F9MII3_9ZZZZ
MEWDENYREMFAALAHEQWSGWMKYMFSKGMRMDGGQWVMPKQSLDRWTRQMNTAYDDLPEDEKESDRVEADKMMAIANTRCNDICSLKE